MMNSSAWEDLMTVFWLACAIKQAWCIYVYSSCDSSLKALWTSCITTRYTRYRIHFSTQFSATYQWYGCSIWFSKVLNFLLVCLDNTQVLSNTVTKITYFQKLTFFGLKKINLYTVTQTNRQTTGRALRLVVCQAPRCFYYSQQ